MPRGAVLVEDGADHVGAALGVDTGVEPGGGALRRTRRRRLRQRSYLNIKKQHIYKEKHINKT